MVLNLIFAISAVFVFNNFIYPVNQTVPNNLPRVRVPFLDCSVDNVAGCNVGLRPIGKNGINFEVRYLLNGKTVYFNTGHGGSGVCLAPACAMEAIRIFEKNNPNFDKNKTLAVIGAGYSGLFVAKFLHEKGYKVKIYAAQMPEKNYIYNGGPCITSLVAAGFWMPFGLKMSNQALYKKLMIDSWNYYYHNQFVLPGVSMRDVYEVSEKDPLQVDALLAEVIGTSKRVEVTVDGKKYTPAWHYRTFLIDGNLLVNSIYDFLQEAGVNFELKQFNNLMDVEALKEEIIFNCTGFGSKALFGDDIMTSKGQLIYLKDKTFPCFFRGYVNGQKVCIYPGSRGTVIGLFCKDGDEVIAIDEEEQKGLLERAQRFMESLL